MSTATSKLVVGLGPVTASVVEPILGSGIKFIEEPTELDIAKADGAIVRAAYVVDKKVLDKAPNLKVIARTGVGFDLVDIEESNRRGIPVVITPGSNTNAVAEGALAHILHLSKRLGPLTKLVASGKFKERTNYPVGDLEGNTLGIIGYGRIGQKVAQLAKAFGMEVIAFDPYANIPDGIKVATLAELISKSEVITLHIPLTPETSGLINAETLKTFNSGTLLVNCSRGALVDLDAALSALNSGKLGGLGLDVFDPEPPIHHAIFDHENVVLTPHVMGLSKQATLATFIDAAKGVRDVLDGVEPKAIANSISYKEVIQNRNERE
jgi:phosphoglycerate dehydrogenase-like enzyme